jgi:hypothetical protein
MPRFTEIEQESIVLNAVWQMIDDMVNYGMFVKHQKLDNTNLMFNTSTHMRLFNILLVDFLSLPQSRRGGPLPFDLPNPPSSARESNLTFLFHVRRVCDDPKLNGKSDLNKRR